MCDTFNVYNDECFSGKGEHIITSRFGTWSIFGKSLGSYKRGDIIVFTEPNSEENKYLIKRIIGMPGDTIRIKDGLVYLQDEDGSFVELEEDYLNEDNKGNTLNQSSADQRYTVPEGQYFVMGDNRARSSDSRRCFKQVGCTGNATPYLDEANIEGEVKLVFFPLNHFRLIKNKS